jgi:DnaJ-class molecular chaperone
LNKYAHNVFRQSLDNETVKSEFRRIAKIIHPDKNKHPDAGVAFQKIHKVYEAVVGRIEGR